MKKTRTIVGIMLAALLALSGCALCACGSQASSGSNSSSSQQQGKGPGGAGKGGMGGTDKSSDAELQAMIAEVAPAFTQESYTDPETIIDDRNGQTVTDYVTLTPRPVESIAGKYAVDMGRIYGTGQSMGAMTTLYLACNNPDLHAAVLIVDGQWDTSQLPDIATQKMIYITSGGDQSALAGQDAVKELLTSKGVPFSSVSGLDAQASADTLNKSISDMLAVGDTINFITWEAGTVLGSSSRSGGTSEHMASFDYGYKLSSVRDWIFEQHT